MKTLKASMTCFLLSLFVFLAISEAEVKTPDGFADELVLDGLNTPVGLAELPGGYLVVIEQYSGVVRLVSLGEKVTVDSLLTIEDINIGGNERGLLGVACDPDFGLSPYLYFYFTAVGKKSVLARYTVTVRGSRLTINPASRYDILNDIPDNAWNHNGGTVRFGPDGLLYLSLGDDATPCAAQRTDDFRGGILRLDVSRLPKSGSSLPASELITPADNPFVSGSTFADSLTFVYGLRNPFRFHIDPQSGDLLIADVGLLDFEEIDYAPSGPAGESGGGGNYGWPFAEGPALRAQPGCQRSNTTNYLKPIAFYDRTGHQASVISLALYRHPKSASHAWPDEYDGDYFFFDYFVGDVQRLTFSESVGWNLAAPVSGQPDSSIWASGLQTVSDGLIGSDGALYYVRQYNSDYETRSGQIRRIRYVGGK